MSNDAHIELLRQNPEMLREIERLDVEHLSDSPLETGSQAPTEECGLPPEYADDALALRFSDLHATLRYTDGWGRWMFWGGTHWRRDETLQVFNLARVVCRAASAECGTEKIATRIASAVTIAAVERLARADRRHAATVSQWDADAWALNTPAGIVNLQTGELRTAKPDDYCTKITAASPGGLCPMWLTFLYRITAGNTELQRFLQRVCGYALTGVTREHALFFLYGTGANGKSVFLGTISGIMGEYARTAPIEAFIASRAEHHPTELAGLHGARLVTALETEDGRRWAESKIKALTGGDRIAARFMRQDFFEFIPQFKLVIAGNHKPGLRTVDEAIRRRLHLIPFTVTIPPEERDLELADKLRAEWGAILLWAIQGCLEWQKEGLNAPEVVRNATEDYLAAEDALGRWMDECCVLGPAYSTAGATLFDSWRGWCERNNEHAGSQKRFGQSLESRPGIGRTRIGQGRTRGFVGIALETDTTDSS